MQMSLCDIHQPSPPPKKNGQKNKKFMKIAKKTKEAENRDKKKAKKKELQENCGLEKHPNRCQQQQHS